MRLVWYFLRNWRGKDQSRTVLEHKTIHIVYKSLLNDHENDQFQTLREPNVSSQIDADNGISVYVETYKNFHFVWLPCTCSKNSWNNVICWNLVNNSSQSNSRASKIYLQNILYFKMATLCTEFSKWLKFNAAFVTSNKCN